MKRSTVNRQRSTGTAFHIALTGNVAAGKSAVSARWRDWGATVIDADAIVRELQQPGTAVSHQIGERFGRDVVSPDGTLDRAALRRRVLADPAERKALEEIVHPAVQTERARLLEAARGSGAEVVVSDIPLLFEAADPAGFDAVVLVDAPEAVRFTRLLERGLPGPDAAALLRLQLPAEPKRARADFVIDNDASREVLRDRAWLVWRKLVSDARSRTRPRA